jgi:NosR/NirI family nitrous oxide reductase transcriptional regulator
VRVTPDFCTQCRLCESSCPYGAMREPQPNKPQPSSLAPDRKRLTLLLVSLPFLMGAGGWLGWQFSVPASHLHPTVSLAERLIRSEKAVIPTGALSAEDLALARGRQDQQNLILEAVSIRHKFAIGGWMFGGWTGLVIAVKLISLSIRRARTDYEPDRGGCFACARCFEFCPNELTRRGVTPIPQSTVNLQIARKAVIISAKP